MGKKNKPIEKKSTDKTTKSKNTSKGKALEKVTLKNEKKEKNIQLLDKISLIGSIVIIVVMALVLCFALYRNNKNEFTSYNNDDVEIEEYNSIFEGYAGQSVNGSVIKQLVNDVIDNNCKYVGQKGKFVSIDVADMRNFENDYLVAACTMSRLDNNQDNVNYATEQMKNFINIVDDSKMYNVFMEKTDNRITDIEILETQN